MSVLDRFKRKKEEVRIPTEIPKNVPTTLPNDLEKFRLPQPESRTDFYDKPLEVPTKIEGDKIELILQKLDTIDTRLKLIEEKIKRY